MRFVAGLLLVIAAILKATQLVADPAAALTSPLGTWLQPLQVGVELGIGLLILTGIYWQHVRWAALLLFAAFTAYSLYLAFSGAASCGCFGPIKVHPWWTFSLDVAVVAGLLVSVLREQNAVPWKWRRTSERPRHQAVLSVIVGLSIVIVALLARYASSRTALAGEALPAAGGLVILEPEKWIGKQLPIADAIDLDLSRGEWIVLLHRHDCPDCQQAVPQYEELAAANPGRKIALVEVPPYGNAVAIASAAGHHARLRNDRDWFVQTPVEVRLAEGVVTAASTELPALLSLPGR